MVTGEQRRMRGFWKEDLRRMGNDFAVCGFMMLGAQEESGQLVESRVTKRATY